MHSDPAPDAGFCRIDDLGLLGFEGPDARAFLQGQLSNDVEALSHGLTNKLLHAPTRALNDAPAADRGTLRELVARLYSLRSGR